MKNYQLLKLYVTTICIFFSFHSFGQLDSCWTVLLLKKGKKLEQRIDMTSYSANGFYLYRNVVYNIVVKEERIQAGRLIDIKKDSLYFTISLMKIVL